MSFKESEDPSLLTGITLLGFILIVILLYATQTEDVPQDTGIKQFVKGNFVKFCIDDECYCKERAYSSNTDIPCTFYDKLTMEEKRY